MISELGSNLLAIKEACRRRHVRTLVLFGSAARGEFRSGESDLDFLVEFSSVAGASKFDDFFGLELDLEAATGCKVDLVEPKTVTNPYFAKAIQDAPKLEIYDAA